MGFERIYIIFLCINLVLMVGGFSVTEHVGANMQGNITEIRESDSGSASKLLSMLSSVLGFFFGDGILGLLASAGMPESLQLLIGLPLMVLGIFGLLSLIVSSVALIKAFIPGG